MQVPKLLLAALDDLGQEDFHKFKWHLSLTHKIPRSHLENAPRTKTVDEIMKRHRGQKAVEVTADVLQQMGFNAAADELRSSHAGAADALSSDTSPNQPRVPRQSDVVLPVSSPAGGNPATPPTPSSSAAVPPAAPAVMMAHQRSVIVSGNSGPVNITMNK